MLEQSNLPDGIHVETDRDNGTIHVVNRSDRIIAVDLSDKGVGVLVLSPGRGVAFYEGTNVVTLTAPRCPPRLG